MEEWALVNRFAPILLDPFTAVANLASLPQDITALVRNQNRNIDVCVLVRLTHVKQN